MVDRKEKLVSVIVPVHNAEKYLEEAVESVRKQTYTDWELILVENGSADQSLELCTDSDNLRISQRNCSCPELWDAGSQRNQTDVSGFG